MRTLLSGRLVPLSFVGTILISAGTYLAIKQSDLAFPPFWGAALRFFATSGLFFSAVAMRRSELPRGRAAYGAVSYGILGFGTGNALLYFALQEVQVGTASVVLSTVPLVTGLLAFLQGQEPLSRRGLLGGSLAFVGAGIVFLTQLSLAIPVASLLALVGAVTCISESSVLLKRFPSSDAFSTLAVASLVGSALLLLVSFLAHETWTLPSRSTAWTSLGFLVFFGSIALLMYLLVLTKWSAASTNYSFVMIPLVTIILASALSGEATSGTFVLGSALVLVGVYVGTLSRARGANHAGSRTASS